MGPKLLLFFAAIPIIASLAAETSRKKRGYHSMVHTRRHTFQVNGQTMFNQQIVHPRLGLDDYEVPLHSKAWTGRKAFRAFTQTVNGVTETTLWYYNSNGPNFKFKVWGPVPAPEGQMIDWIERNYKQYNVIHVPYEGDVPDTPQHPDPPLMYPTPAPTYPTYPTPAPTYPTFATQPPIRRTYPPRTTAVTWTTTTTTPTPVRNELTWNQILPSECGYSGYILGKHVLGKVVGASPAPIELNPWQVALVDASSKALKCGGTIISKNHVLTASHCFLTIKKKVGVDGKISENDEIVPKIRRLVYAGDENINKPAATYKIAELFLHTRYSNSHRRNDIALILIEGEFYWSTRIYPICLPTKDAAYTPSRPCRVSGWGQKASENLNTEEYLQAAIINIIEPKTCSSNYEKRMNISGGMFCAAGFDKNLGRADTCQGDSGGPCTCDENDRGTLYGITSWGIGCGRENYPGVYVKVAKYLNWIRERLEVSVGSRSRSSLTYDEDIGGPAEVLDPSEDPDADIL